MSDSTEALAALDEWRWKADGKPRLRSYYFSFTPTGVEAIDLILSAVALAGKRFHSTDGWQDASVGIPSAVDVIQAAAQEAARKLGEVEEISKYLDRYAEGVRPELAEVLHYAAADIRAGKHRT